MKKKFRLQVLGLFIWLVFAACTCVTVEVLRESFFHCGAGACVAGSPRSAVLTAGRGGNASAYVGSYASSSTVWWSSAELCAATSELIVGVRVQVEQYSLQVKQSLIIQAVKMNEHVLPMTTTSEFHVEMGRNMTTKAHTFLHSRSNFPSVPFLFQLSEKRQ